MTRLWPEGKAVEAWGRNETPDGFVWDGASHHVLEVCNRWRVHTRWWEPSASTWREYIKVATDKGLLCLLYQDLPGGTWFLARVYD